MERMSRGERSNLTEVFSGSHAVRERKLICVLDGWITRRSSWLRDPKDLNTRKTPLRFDRVRRSEQQLTILTLRYSEHAQLSLQNEQTNGRGKLTSTSEMPPLLGDVRVP